MFQSLKNTLLKCYMYIILPAQSYIYNYIPENNLLEYISYL